MLPSKPRAKWAEGDDRLKPLASPLPSEAVSKESSRCGERTCSPSGLIPSSSSSSTLMKSAMLKSTFMSANSVSIILAEAPTTAADDGLEELELALRLDDRDESEAESGHELSGEAEDAGSSAKSVRVSQAGGAGPGQRRLDGVDANMLSGS